MRQKLGTIQKEFQKITLLPLPKRSVNKLGDKVYRKDKVFGYLSDKIFDYPRLLIVLKRKIKLWLKLNNSETLLALAGYVYYLDNNFLKAEKCFYRCVEKAPMNLDNWVDLVFSLYHQGNRKNKVAKNILFNLDLFTKRFKCLKCEKCNLSALDKIYKDLKGERKNYSYNYQKYIIE